MGQRNPRRERLKHILPPVDLRRVNVYPWPIVQPFDLNPGELAQPSKFSKMIDTVGYPMNYNNPVHHKKYQFGGKGLQSFERLILGGQGDPWVTFYFTPELAPPDLTQLLFDSDLIPPQEWFADFAYKADQHFKNAVNPEVLLANYILELIQVITDIIKSLKKLAERFVNALRRFFSKLKEVGDLWIAWNFAIKPFISDSKKIAKSLKTAEKRLAWLRKNNHKDTRVTYRYRPYEASKDGAGQSAPCVELDLIQTQWAGMALYPQLASAECAWQVYDLNIKNKAAANAVVRFDIPDELLSHPNSYGVVWATLMGLNNPAAIVWEATPWSWLIDWFLGMKTRLLIELGEIKLMPDAKILATGHSYTYEVKGAVRWTGPQDRNLVPQVKDLGFATVKIYHRVPGSPVEWSPLLTLNQTWYNASIIAALIRQKRRRR